MARTALIGLISWRLARPNAQEKDDRALSPVVPMSSDSSGWALSGRLRKGYGLHFEIFLETGLAHFTPDAALLVAAERAVTAVPHAAVHREGAGPHPAGDVQGALRIAGHNRA